MQQQERRRMRIAPRQHMMTLATNIDEMRRGRLAG
jgi:hypothetical protein